jgi:hypothetical protein
MILTVHWLFVVMKKFLLIAVFLFILPISPSSADNQSILLRLPEPVVADIIGKSLPFDVQPNADSLAGSISVTRIDQLAFSDQALSAAMSLTGREVQLNTSIGGHQLRLNVGTVDLNFDVSAQVRFDPGSQTLFIRPIISGLEQQTTQSNEVAKLIAALFNDREIPLALDKMQPIITDIGSSELIIDTLVKDVQLQPGSIDILLTPTASTRKN